MRHVPFVVVLVVLAGGLGPASGRQGPAAPATRTLSRAALVDKVRGGWAGQMIGVSFGAPTEFRSNGAILEGNLPAWTPGRIENAIDQDDLYVEMTFAAVMDKVGLEATSEQYGEAFKTSQYELWHANAGARRLLDRGIKAPWSGHPRYNVHANDIDFQIESDFIGLMTPGLPRAATRYAERVGRVMNYGDGLYGGVFVTNMYAAAFFEPDPRKVVEAGLAALPAASGYARIIRDVLKWAAENPNDWRRTWHLIEDTWDKDDPCPDGALAPFNIDAKLNGAYIALGLLYGGRDFGKTLEVATRAGQDSDCNPSNAAGILGVMLGYDAIPAEWKSGLAALQGRKFAFTDYSFDTIVASTLARAMKVITAAGGRVDDKTVVVPAQTPQPPALEQWDPGKPARRIPATAPEWTWKGGWGAPPANRANRDKDGRLSSLAGNEATLTFDGTGIIVVGEMAQDGGRADVFLDGKAAGQLEAYIPPRTHDNALWHAFGLPPGRHTLRIVTRADHAPNSTGLAVEIDRAVTYTGGSPTPAPQTRGN
jgi:hypothetical protein